MRVAFVLPGLHRVRRGAEVAFQSVARELAQRNNGTVTLFGSGPPDPQEPYAFEHVPCRDRERFERWPKFPGLRSTFAYEELTFVRHLWRRFDPAAFDLTVTCAYPFCNWLLRGRKRRGRRPAHVFVTQNGDWPAFARQKEFALFGCDGLVCINPEMLERNRERWRCALIPNGLDPERFSPGPGDRATLGVPADRPVALIVSALVPDKRVTDAVRSVAQTSEFHLLVAGDGPLRAEVDRLGAELLGDRYQRVTVPHDQMPTLYRSADVLLHMRQNEPFGNIYVEAMATGLPVVAHDDGKTRWIVGPSGQLANTSDPAAVAAALRAALAPDIRQRAADRVTEVRSRFAWSTVAAAYADFFTEVLEARHVH